MPIQRIIEQIVDTDGNFSMTQLSDAVWPSIEALPNISGVAPVLHDPVLV